MIIIYVTVIKECCHCKAAGQLGHLVIESKNEKCVRNES
jgi:hypothetical protein